MKLRCFVLLCISVIAVECNAQISNGNVGTYFVPQSVTYNRTEVNGLEIFYRECGDKSKPVVLLLHGYPSSSHTYRNLMPMLSAHYRVIAPDNIGSGLSGYFSPDSVVYTFDLLADYLYAFLKKLEVSRVALYMQDFGAPVGYRLMQKDTQMVPVLIVQNANAYMEGLTELRQDFFRKAHFDTTSANIDFLYSLTSEDAIIYKQYLFDLDSSTIHLQSPDAWIHDLNFLRTPQRRKIQVQLFQDYYSNLLAYKKWQEMLRKHKPRTLIIWGARDKKFNANGAKAYLNDLPDAELHLLDAGHFAAEEKTTEVAYLMLDFLSRQKW